MNNLILISFNLNLTYFLLVSICMNINDLDVCFVGTDKMRTVNCFWNNEQRKSTNAMGYSMTMSFTFYFSNSYRRFR